VTTTKLPLRNPAGEIIGTFGVSRDITELKLAEDAVADSEQLYHSLVDSLAQNVFRKDLWGRVTFANSTYCQTLGRSLRDLLGQTDFDLFPKELAEKYVADDRKVIETRQPLDLIEEHRKPTGELIYVQVVKTPIVDSAGRVVGTQGMFWDVTEKKLYEETLERLAAIVESSEDAIIGASIDGTILSWNPGAERLYGYAAGEIIGKPIEALVPPRLRDEVQAIKERMAADDRISNLETLRVTKDGREIKVSVSVAPIKNGGGRIVGISGITRDISARSQAEQAIDELAAIMRSSPDAIIGHTLEGTVTTWNPAAEKLYGYSGDEMLGKSITMLSPPEKQDELFTLVGRVAREERIDAFPTVHVARDGRRLDVTLTVSPVVDTELDRVTGISIIARVTK
jgi:PAS domain S-box-containing protein